MVNLCEMEPNECDLPERWDPVIDMSADQRLGLHLKGLLNILLILE